MPFMQKSKLCVLFLLGGLTLLLLACETTDVLRVAMSGSAENAPSSAVERTPTEKPTRSPNDPFPFNPLSAPRCFAGSNSASLVRGRVLDASGPVVGQRVEASSAPGGAPVNDPPVETDAQGNFQLTFACGGAACDGAYWIWLADENAAQISPYVQFQFDNNCRVGSVDFSGG